MRDRNLVLPATKVKWPLSGADCPHCPSILPGGKTWRRKKIAGRVSKKSVENQVVRAFRLPQDWDAPPVGCLSRSECRILKSPSQLFGLQCLKSGDKMEIPATIDAGQEAKKEILVNEPHRRCVMLSKVICVLGTALLCGCTKPVPRYGSNPAAGKTFTHDGVQLYYEVYGAGEPLLLVHGNGGSIADLKAQIDHFRTRYKVIAMDSRDQGKSGDSPDKITYEKMTDDLAALLDDLKTGPVNVLGWSDGGIQALLLGIRHPAKVKKIAAMAANLNPSEQAVYTEIITFTKSMMDSMPAAARETQQGKRELKVTQMMFDEPHIDATGLEAITAPTLVLAADHDLVRDEHTLDIYHHIPNSQLCIFPNSTHMVPYDDPALFNVTVEHFFRAPFAKKDRVKDFFKSFQAMRTSQE
jgi:pimeloyl-ACP methyl ester carboxylesterase